MTRLDPNAGVYAFIFTLGEAIHVEIGALGKHRLAPGRYVYVGSAKQHLRQRVERHFKPDKPTHWHIDYLTTHPVCECDRALLFDGETWSECQLNQRVEEFVADAPPVDGFGASDCDAGCPAHLWRISSDGAAKIHELAMHQVTK